MPTHWEESQYPAGPGGPRTPAYPGRPGGPRGPTEPAGPGDPVLLSPGGPDGQRQGLVRIGGQREETGQIY